MNTDPIKNLIEDLGSRLARRGHRDVVFNNGEGRKFEIKPSEFSEIKPTDSVRRIAFVDGGDGLLDESPNFLITINRAYFSIFRGRDRIRPKSDPKIQFLSHVISNIHANGGKKKIRYGTRMFAYGDEDGCRLPSEADLAGYVENASIFQSTKFSSLGRRFAEWTLALHVVENELQAGDMIVMDGSLQTRFRNEVKYANRLYDAAIKKGVTVCGLAKTSRLVTESGDPLFARIEEIAEAVPFDTWHVRVAERVTPDDRGFMFAVRLHERSQFVFRFEILLEQFEKMSPDGLNSVFYSLVANSQDLAMLGYPYGAIDADRFAQVRMNELDMYRGLVLSEKLKKPEWARLQKYGASLKAHDVLNGVTS